MCKGYCASEDSMGNCDMLDSGMYEGDDRPTGCDEQGLCMDCRSLEDCDEFDLCYGCDDCAPEEEEEDEDD